MRVIYRPYGGSLLDFDQVTVDHVEVLPKAGNIIYVDRKRLGKVYNLAFYYKAEFAEDNPKLTHVDITLD